MACLPLARRKNRKKERKKLHGSSVCERTVSVVRAYHQKPERYEEAEPEHVGAAAHPRRLDAFLILATGAAGHPVSPSFPPLRYGATPRRPFSSVGCVMLCLPLRVLLDSEYYPTVPAAPISAVTATRLYAGGGGLPRRGDARRRQSTCVCSNYRSTLLERS